MAKNQLRPRMAVLKLAIDYAEDGGDPRAFLLQQISESDGAAWLPCPQPPQDPVLQREVKSLLKTLIARDPYETELRFVLGVKPHEGSVVVTRARARGVKTVRDLFLYRLVRLLEEVGIERLRECPRCGRVFLKVTRKEFCSTKCQAAVNMQNQRARIREEKRKELRRYGKQTRKR